MKAVAVLKNESRTIDIVEFEQENENRPTTVKAIFYYLPRGNHGFHIHEFGDATNGCISAGPHFNPFNKRHGGPQSNERHIGDMGNVWSDGDELTCFEIHDSSIVLSGPYSVIGRSCVIHADEDDLGQGEFEDSPTTGHSGARLACGVIGLCKS
jgi:superoxide dismutase, Cu-Zn family